MVDELFMDQIQLTQEYFLGNIIIQYKYERGGMFVLRGAWLSGEATYLLP